MTFFGKEIPTDKINFVMNVVSFVLGIIFFIRMQVKFSQPETSVPVYNAEHDSLIKIETRLNMQVMELKNIQDSLFKIIKRSEIKLAEQNSQVKAKRLELHSIVSSDWDGLSSKDQNAYLNKILSNLKEKQK